MTEHPLLNTAHPDPIRRRLAFDLLQFPVSTLREDASTSSAGEHAPSEPNGGDSATDSVTPYSVYLSLQLQESNRAEALADHIATWAYWRGGIDYLDRGTASTCRYLATHALRSTQAKWLLAARRHAVDACVDALKTECGKEAAQWSDAQRHTIARLLAGRIIGAYHSITEGSTVLPPATYLEIAREP